MSRDLSSEEVITDKLEGQQRTIEMFAGKIKSLELELASTKKMLDEAKEERNAYRDMSRGERADCFKLIAKIEKLESELNIAEKNRNIFWNNQTALEEKLRTAEMYFENLIHWTDITGLEERASGIAMKALEAIKKGKV